MRASRGVAQAKSATSMHGPALPATRGFGHLRPSGGKPLPRPLQARMEGAFGHSFSDVRVHLGGLPEAIGANAFARGSDLFFKPTNYDPWTRQGQALIGHELAHVVQQRQRRVAPTHRAEPLIANLEPHLENEADRAGEAVSAPRPMPLTGLLAGPSAPGAGRSGPAPPAQLQGGSLQRLRQLLGYGGIGRAAAVAHTSLYPPGTLGHVVHRPVKVLHKLAGDFASGDIGRHYQDRSEALAEAATPKRIESFAQTETKWWKQQPGLPGLVGGLLPWQARAGILKFTHAPTLAELKKRAGQEDHPWLD